MEQQGHRNNSAAAPARRHDASTPEPRQPFPNPRLAFVGLTIQLTAYLRVAQPVNRALTAIALQGTVPPTARSLQTRWDSVIDLRAIGITLGMTGLSLYALTVR